mgnify:CR=1 FL=1
MKKKFIKNNFIVHFMKNGKKATSEKLLLKLIKLIQKKLFVKKFESIFKLSVINSSPHVFLKKLKRRKKVPLEVPFLLKKSLKISYGIKLITQACVKANFQRICFDQILESSKFQGSTIKIINELYKKSFVNKKLANYRWF